MKTRLVASVSLFLSLLMVASVVTTAANAALPEANYSQARATTAARIAWSPTSIQRALSVGSSLTVQARFTSSRAIARPTFRISSATPSFFRLGALPTTIAANTPYPVAITISIPAGYSGRAISGSIVVVDQRALDSPLKIKITATPSATAQPSVPGVGGTAPAAGDFPLGAFEDFNALNPTSFGALIDDAKAHNLDGVMLTNGQAEHGVTYLSAADNKGFNVYMGPLAELNSEWYYSSNVTVDIATARNIVYPLVDQMKSHASLKGYYVFDEPSVDQRTKVALAVQAFQERDPSRAAFPVLIGTDRVGPIFSAANPKTMVIDVYPYGWDNPAGDTTMSGYGYSMDMVSYIRQVTAAKPATTPLWIILQGHRFGDGTGGFDLRQPSPAEARIENWIAVGEGAKGIFWFLYGSQPVQQLVGYRDNPALYAEISSLARRVSSLRALLLTLNKTTDRFAVSGSANPYVSTLTDGTKNFAVVVNRSNNPSSISVSSSLGGRLKDLETSTIYGLNAPINFAAGDGKVFELVP